MPTNSKLYTDTIADLHQTLADTVEKKTASTLTEAVKENLSPENASNDPYLCIRMARELGRIAEQKSARQARRGFHAAAHEALGTSKTAVSSISSFRSPKQNVKEPDLETLTQFHPKTI